MTMSKPLRRHHDHVAQQRQFEIARSHGSKISPHDMGKFTKHHAMDDGLEDIYRSKNPRHHANSDKARLTKAELSAREMYHCDMNAIN